jgi:Zn-finger nucleic acid-binding protein
MRHHDNKKRSPMERLCPKCRDKMHERPLGQSGIRIDMCPTCHGIWFDRWELEGHLGGPGGEVIPGGDACITERSCPKCRIVMTNFTASGSDVSVDHCEECKGIWLDPGELKRLEEAKKPQKGWLGSIAKMLGF